MIKAIKVQDLTRDYNGLRAVDGINFEVVNMPRWGTIKHEKSCSSAWRCWRQRGIVTTAGIKVGESLVP